MEGAGISRLLQDMNFPLRLAPLPIAHGLLAVVVLVVVATGLHAQQKPEELQQRIDRLIGQLGDEDYFVRQRAQAELSRLGLEAFDALSAAENHEDLEIASRVRYLLRSARMQWTVENQPQNVKELLDKYELRNMEERLEVIRTLGALPDGVGVAALCRLVRFEKLPALSKAAAVEVLLAQPPGRPPGGEFAESLRKNLGHSRHQGAKWLLAYLKFADDPQAALADWSKLVDVEIDTFRRSPAQSSTRIIVALVRVQSDWLSGLGQTDEAVAAMRKLIDLVRGDPETLQQLVDWLIEQQAWTVLDELASRFSGRFDGNITLLYSLAEARAGQGKEKLAEETAQRALKLSQGKSFDALEPHYSVARRLWRRGKFKWAEREFRHVIDSSSNEDRITEYAQHDLAEMLHDQGDYLRAAELLQQMVQGAEKVKKRQQWRPRRPLSENRARMHYFFAQHWAAKGDQAKQCEHLDEAMKDDTTDIDVLIGCYRHPNPTPEYRQKVLKLIHRETAKSRAQIGEPSLTGESGAIVYNQLAWLISNTEGDFDEAVKLSRKSLELSPGNGGYYDTLARCYFAKGDYENALKYQEKAAELEPHSGLIAKQYELFRKTVDEKAKEDGPK